MSTNTDLVDEIRFHRGYVMFLGFIVSFPLLFWNYALVCLFLHYTFSWVFLPLSVTSPVLYPPHLFLVPLLVCLFIVSVLPLACFLFPATCECVSVGVCVCVCIILVSNQFAVTDLVKLRSRLEFRVLQGYWVWYWNWLDRIIGDCWILVEACALLITVFFVNFANI